MLLKSLYLHHFRTFEERLFEFGPQANFIVGENASGKTTVLEAVHFLMTGRSFRSSKSSELIKFGTQGFFLEARFEKKGVLQKIRIATKGKERKVIVNHTTHSAFSHVLGCLQGVVMTPDDASLVKEAPVYRRDFLDQLISQTDPLFVHHMTRFSRAMRQRNVLLRSKNSLSIEGFEHEMGKSALYIMGKRQEAISSLSQTSASLYRDFCEGDEELTLLYKPSLLDPENYIKLLSSMRKKEEIVGSTLFGPHKDDFQILIGGHDVRYFGSEGQQRSVVIALKLGEWQRLKTLSEESPLMLLDDVSMSLDLKRQGKLFSMIESLDQVFLTTTGLTTLPFSKKRTDILMTKA
jgi:DNA replication and repair protein RecF